MCTGMSSTARSTRSTARGHASPPGPGPAAPQQDDDKASQAGARQKPTFKHSLGKISDPEHFAGAIVDCSNMSGLQNGEDVTVSQSVVQSLIAVEQANPQFPCRPSSRVSRPTTEDQGGGPSRPTSVENPRASRIFLGHKVNEMAQAGLSIGDVCKDENGWKRWQELRETAAQLLYPVAHNSFKIAVGIDRSNTPAPVVPFSYLPVGPKECVSLVDVNNAVMVHHWSCSVSANNFHRGWYAVQSAIVEFGLEGLAVPFTSIFCFDGSYVSTTALPPITSTSATTSVAPPSSTILSRSLGILEAVLGLDVMSLKPCLGQDGRVYFTNTVAYAMQWRLPMYPRLLLRWELARRFLVSTERHGGMKLAQYIDTVGLPAAVELCMLNLSSRSSDNQILPALLRDGVIPQAVHGAGLNMRLLYRFALRAQRRADSFGRLIADATLTEMVGRTAKDMILFEVEQREKKGFVGERDRLEVINRVVRLLIARDMPFWTSHLVPAVKKKYLISAPQGEEQEELPIDITRVHIASVLKMVSTRTATMLVPETGRFDKFVTLSETKTSLIEVPHYRKYGLGIQVFQDVAEAVRRCSKKDTVLREGLIGHAILIALYGKSFVVGTQDVAQLYESQCTSDMSPAQRARLLSMMVFLQVHSTLWLDDLQKALCAGLDCNESDARIIVDRNVNVFSLQLRAAKEQAVTLKGIEVSFSSACKSNAFQWNCTPTYIAFLLNVAHRLPDFAETEREVFFQMCTNISVCIGGQQNAGQLQAELAQNICRACVDVVEVESMPALNQFTFRSLEIARKNKGCRNSCSIMLTYFLAYYTLHNIAVTNGEAESSVRPAIGAVSKIVEKTLALSTKQQVSTAAAFVPNSVLYKISALLRRMNRPKVAEMLVAHISVFCSSLLSAYTIQRIGRAYMARVALKDQGEGASGGLADGAASPTRTLKREATSAQLMLLTRQASQLMTVEQLERDDPSDEDEESVSGEEEDDEPGIQIAEVPPPSREARGQSFVVVMESHEESVPTEADIDREKFMLVEHDQRRNVFKDEVRIRFELLGLRDQHRRIAQTNCTNRLALLASEEAQRTKIDDEYDCVAAERALVLLMLNEVHAVIVLEGTKRHSLIQQEEDAYNHCGALAAADYLDVLERLLPPKPATPMFTNEASAPRSPVEADAMRVTKEVGPISPRLDIEHTVIRLKSSHRPPSTLSPPQDECGLVMSQYQVLCKACIAAGPLQLEHEGQSAKRVGDRNTDAYRESRSRLRQAMEDVTATILVEKVVRALPPVALREDVVVLSGSTSPSFVDERHRLLVHVWRDRHAAEAFQECFEAAAAAQTIVPHGIFAAPCSVLMSYQCAMITASWIVPADFGEREADHVSVENHADKMFQHLFGMTARCCFSSRDACLVYIIPSSLERSLAQGLRHEHHLCDLLGFGSSNRAERDEFAVNRACSAVRRHLTYVGPLKHSTLMNILRSANVDPSSLYALWTSDGIKCGSPAVDFEVSRLMLNSIVALAFRNLVDNISHELDAMQPCESLEQRRRDLLRWASKLYVSLLSSTALLRKSLIPIMVAQYGFPSDFAVSPQLLSLKMVMSSVEYELGLETSSTSGPTAWLRPTLHSFSDLPRAPSSTECEVDAQECVKRVLHSSDVAIRQGLLLRAMNFVFNPSPVLNIEADRWLESSPIAAVSYLALRNSTAPTEQGFEREITQILKLSRESAENVRYISLRLCDLWTTLRTWKITSPMWNKWINAAVEFYSHATITTPTLHRVAAELVEACDCLASSPEPLAVLVLARNNVASTIASALLRHTPTLLTNFVARALVHPFLRSLDADDADVRCQALLPLVVLYPFIVSKSPPDVTENMNMVLVGCIGALFVVLKATSSLVAPHELTFFTLQLSELCAVKRKVTDNNLQWSLEEATLLSNVATLAVGSCPYVLTCCKLLALVDSRVPLSKNLAATVRQHAGTHDAKPSWDADTLADNVDAFIAQAELQWRYELKRIEGEHHRRVEAQAAVEVSRREIREQERIARHARQVKSLFDEEEQLRVNITSQESQLRVILSQNERTDLEWSDGAVGLRQMREVNSKEEAARILLLDNLLRESGRFAQFVLAVTAFVKKMFSALEDLDDYEFTERDELKDFFKEEKGIAIERQGVRLQSELCAGESASRQELDVIETNERSDIEGLSVVNLSTIEEARRKKCALEQETLSWTETAARLPIEGLEEETRHALEGTTIRPVLDKLLADFFSRIEARSSRRRREFSDLERNRRANIAATEEAARESLLKNGAVAEDPESVKGPQHAIRTTKPELEENSVLDATRPRSREDYAQALVEAVVIRASSRERTAVTDDSGTLQAAASRLSTTEALGEEWVMPITEDDSWPEEMNAALPLDVAPQIERNTSMSAIVTADTVLRGSWTHVPTPHSASVRTMFEVPEGLRAGESDDDDSNLPSRIPTSSLFPPSSGKLSSSGKRPPKNRPRKADREQGTQTSVPSTPRATKAAPADIMPIPLDEIIPMPPVVEKEFDEDDDDPRMAAAAAVLARPPSRQSSASRLLQEINDAKATSGASLSLPLDILYRSAQQSHSFGPVFACLLFMDIGGPRTDEELAVRRRPSARKERTFQSTSVEIAAMQRKVIELEAASVAIQLKELVGFEHRRRVHLEGELECDIKRFVEQEDADRIVAQLRVDRRISDERRVGAAADGTLRRGGSFVAAAAADDDEEIAALKERSRRLFAGQRVNQREGKERSGELPPLKSRNVLTIPVVNPVSDMLRQLRKELGDLDPAERRASKELGPLVTPTTASSMTLQRQNSGMSKPPRVNSAQATRPSPRSFSLPFSQSKLLTAEKLPPIVSTVLSDRDFSKMDETLPPASSTDVMNTPLGPVLPCVARTAVDIAIMKQQIAMEVERESHGSLVPLLRSSSRPLSANVRPKSASTLTDAIAKANRTVDAVCAVQTFARAFAARQLRLVRAGRCIVLWTEKKSFGSVNRKRTLREFKRAAKADESLTRDYFEKYTIWLHRRREAKLACRSVVVSRIVERRVFGAVRSRDLLAASTIPHLLFRYFEPWRARGCHRLQLQRLEKLSLVNQQRHARVRLQQWADNFSEGKIHFGPEIRRALASLRLERKNKTRVLERYFGKFTNFYVQCLKRREGKFQMISAHRHIVKCRVEREVDRVWCIAMIESGWARKYFKSAYHQWHAWLLARKPHLAHKKRKPLYNLQ